MFAPARFPLVRHSAPFPSQPFQRCISLHAEGLNMKRTIAALAVVTMLSTGSLAVLAADTSTRESVVPPAAIPGLNQGTESNHEKASKKGEEASGSNSGVDAQTHEKEAASTQRSKHQTKKQAGSASGS